MPTVKVNDLTMYYEIHGDGPPLVLINGLGGDISKVGALIRPLSEHFTVIAFDNRGSGRTDKPDRPYTIEMMADDTAGLLTSLNVGPAAVLGISMGGRIAIVLTLEHPELVSRLILASTSARRGRLSPSVRMSNLLSVLPHMKGRYPQPRYAYRRQLMSAPNFDYSGRLPDVSLPTLIMHGRRDPLIPYRFAKEMHSGIRDSELLTFNGGHFFMFTREHDAFVEAVTTFLQ